MHEGCSKLLCTPCSSCTVSLQPLAPGPWPSLALPSLALHSLERAWPALERAWASLERALDSLKRALHSLQRALDSLERAWDSL